MFIDFQSLDLFPTSASDVIFNLIISLICGLLISVTYRITYRGPNYSTTFVNSLVLLTMITSIVLLVIGNNLARAFGLVGAMSIIRFRTAVRDTMDIIFIFFALSIGMASGVGLTMIAIVGTLIISIVILGLVSFNWGNTRRRDYLLQISYNANMDSEIVMSTILSKFCKKVKLVNLKNIGYGEELEAFYHVMLKDNSKGDNLLKELNDLDDIYNINLYFDEDDANAPT
ncbi:MAG: DUF4956 domain-containing protein [Bacteroidetes bacterium]|jgi:uncharacterized membrane protein YhiD involved in acid resistance|nr:DUF4956 domain-containing protein [Bacteroidota bacterium]MBT6684796.1 DUF4956 domain-containing protein [Bacteroidota bacterium]MBT7141772.1 DUF4956 domain-containing protein [Bacteroidota bacterium]MBT7490740.1 DUF4956 domain-containing protein [Bacteroidota bacterium]